MLFTWRMPKPEKKKSDIEIIVHTTMLMRRWPQEEIDRVMAESKQFILGAIAEHLDKREKEWKNHLHSAGIPHE